MMMLQKHYLVLEKKEEYAKTTLIESQSKWTLFSKDILNIAKELLNKLSRYEVFLQHNSDEIHRKHGINMLKPTFIEQYK